MAGPTARGTTRAPAARRGVTGFTLIETLVSFLLLGLLLQGGWRILASFRTGAGHAAAQAEGVETVRTLAWILSAEVAGEDRGRHWWVEGGDSLPLRVFRGLALVEPGLPGAAELQVCYRGIRTPEPEKDSVLLLATDGWWRPSGLVSRRVLSPTCSGAGRELLGEGRTEAWVLSPPAGPGRLARVFERGSYYLSGGALRYRRGFGGRQPLTPERLLSGRFLVETGGEGALGWEVILATPAGDTAVHPWRGRVR